MVFYPGKNPSEKPYFFFGDYLKMKYGLRVLKLSINAGLGCPHRNDLTGEGGCVFCSEHGSAAKSAEKKTSITEQMKLAVGSFSRGNIETKYIAYFQAFTNTFAETNVLKKLYDEAVSFPDVIGLMIGTRPDCIDEKKAELISSYKKDGFELWLELGMQTIHEKSLEFLNRGHSHNDTIKAVKIASERKINICLHTILGIPGEDWKMMMQTATEISSLNVHGIKIHHLHVLKNTRLHELYQKGDLCLLESEEYTSLVCDFLERIRGDITVHRLSGDADSEDLIAPRWGLHKGSVMKSIEDKFRSRNTYQGFLCD